MIKGIIKIVIFEVYNFEIMIMKIRFKSKLLALLILLSFSGWSQEQKESPDISSGNIGFKVGYGSSGFHGSSANEFNSIGGLSLGVYYVITYTETYEIVDDLSWITKGAKEKSDTFMPVNPISNVNYNSTKIRLGYVEDNLYLKYKIMPKSKATPYVCAGFYSSLLVLGTTKALDKIPTSSINNPPESGNNIDYGVIAGVGYDFGKEGMKNPNDH